MTTEMREAALRVAARRAYEAGRFNGALLRGAGLLAIAFPGFLACGRTPVAALCLGALVAVVIAARWRGEGWDMGARAGALAGLIPCLMPALLRVFDPLLCDVLFQRGPWFCAAGGAAAGVVLGLRSRNTGGPAFWASAVLALALAAALGCLPAGEMGFLGLAAGVLAGGAPILAARRLLA